jgi:RNA polymerase sigma-70 factor, ECF subfamily
LTTLHDRALLSAVAGGDQKAFGELFSTHKDRTYTIAFILTDDPLIAEELVQDVFLRIWKNRDKLTTLDDFAAWLYTITRNRALTALQKIAREGRNRSEFISYLPEKVNDAGSKMDDHDMQQLLETALSRLSKQQRRVFELSRLQGYSREEVAQALGLAPATVSVHLTIALRSVRAFLTSRLDSLLAVFLMIVFFET